MAANLRSVYPAQTYTWNSAGSGTITWDDFLISQGVAPDHDPWGGEQET